MVSGLPNITPIFSRIWLMKITRHVFDFAIAPVSLRMAWLMRRACRPTKTVPHLALDLGPRDERATESTITTSTALERTRSSTISSACSPVSGWLTSRSSSSHAELARIGRVEGVLRVHEGADAALALGVGDATCSARVVLPELSGPKISTTRPRGKTPAAEGQVQADGEPVLMPSDAALMPGSPASPRRMMDPLP